MSDYLQLQCSQYRIVILAALVDTAIALQAVNPQAKTLTYNNQAYPCVNLSAWLLGQRSTTNAYSQDERLEPQPCLIIRSEGLIRSEGRQSMIIAVDHIDGMITIAEREFFSLPPLIYKQDNLFDKAYIDKHKQQCLYRLEPSALTLGRINNT